VSGEDVVFGDDDGVLFVAAARVGEVLAAAQQICRPNASRPPGSGTAKRYGSRPTSTTT
jgi:hypothetical protein